MERGDTKAFSHPITVYREESVSLLSVCQTHTHTHYFYKRIVFISTHAQRHTHTEGDRVSQISKATVSFNRNLFPNKPSLCLQRDAWKQTHTYMN